MKWNFFVVLCALMLAGCAAPQPYDQQFATAYHADGERMGKPKAWVIGLSKAQAEAFEANRQRLIK